MRKNTDSMCKLGRTTKRKEFHEEDKGQTEK